MAGLPFGGNSETPETPSGSSSTPSNESGSPATLQSPAAPAEMSKREAKKAAKQQAKASKQQAKYGVFDPNELKKGRGLFGFLSTGGGKLTLASVILAIGAGVGVYLYTADSSETIQELVLLNDMPANQIITMGDVKPIEVPADSVTDPTLLITEAQINSGLATTKVALKRNTVLTVGSVGSYSRLITEIPDGFQLVSITVEPANAAGGSVAAGDIVDIYGSGGSGDGAGSVFTTGMKGIKVVDIIVNPNTIAKGATVDPNTGEANVGADSPDLRSGIGSVYKLQVTPAQAADIARAVVAGTTFYLVLTNGVSDTPGEAPVVVDPTIPSVPVPNPILDNPVGEALTDAVGGNDAPAVEPTPAADTAADTAADATGTATDSADATGSNPSPVATTPVG